MTEIELLELKRKYKPMLRYGQACALASELGVCASAFYAVLNSGPKVREQLRVEVPGSVKAFYRRDAILDLLQ